MPTFSEVLAEIIAAIVANGSQEITADVLRPILIDILSQPNELIGDLDDLDTIDKSNLVNAINEIANISFTQNNLPKIYGPFGASGSGDLTTEQAATVINGYIDELTVEETDTPVIFSITKTNYQYEYLFLNGSGTYLTIEGDDLYLLAVRLVTPGTIDIPNSQIIDIGTVTTTFLDLANEGTYDFSDSGTINENGYVRTYYLSYTDLEGDLQYAMFVGNPADSPYGAGGTAFVESDFIHTTSGNTLATPGFHQVLLVNPVTTLIARFRDLSREIQVGAGKISRVQSGGPNRTDLVFQNPTAANTQTIQDKSGIVALTSDVDNLDLQAVTDNSNTTTNNIRIGNTTAPIAHLHVGNLNAARSSNPHILIAEAINDASGSGNSHGFADSSNFSRTGTVSYASFDGRFILSGGTFNHIVSFQHNPLVNISGTVADVYGLYTSTLLQSGTISNNYGVYVADAVVTGGSIIDNFGVYIPALTSGVNNYGVYCEDVPSYFRGDLNLWKVDGSVGSGSILRFKSGTSGNGIAEAIIVHEIHSSSRADLVFKVRTSSASGDAGLTEGFRYQGGTIKTLAITGKATVSVAPTNPTDVVRKTELDLKANVDNSTLTGVTTAEKYKLSALNTAPASATDTGVVGEIRVTSDYIYVCVATNTWVRSALTTW